MSDETEGKRTSGFEDEQTEFDRSRDAAARNATTKEILRARPVKAEVDFDELILEHLARFPKIRARLAE